MFWIKVVIKLYKGVGFVSYLLFSSLWKVASQHAVVTQYFWKQNDFLSVWELLWQMEKLQFFFELTVIVSNLILMDATTKPLCLYVIYPALWYGFGGLNIKKQFWEFYIIMIFFSPPSHSACIQQVTGCENTCGNDYVMKVDSNKI